MMARPRDIIYVGNPFQADNRTSSHHIARHLSKSHRLIYLEAGGLRAPRASRSDLAKIVRRVQLLFTPIQEVEPNIFVKSIFALPFGSHPLIGAVNRKIQRLTIRRLFRSFALHNPIIWCVSPALINVVKDVDRSLLVYYCVDDFSSFPDVDVSLILDLDQQLTTLSDIVFTPSKPLFDVKKGQAKRCRLSPHGVDLKHFGRARSAPAVCPEPISGLPQQPIVGFWGLIEDWIDLELVFFLARELADVIFLMIGRVAVEIPEGQIPDNVRFIGQIPYEQLPEYAYYFTVAIIPYKLNKQVYNANPLKLREYLATGKPLVSVSTPETERYRDVVALADGYEEFLEMLNRELDGESHATPEARLRSVENESWSARYEVIWETVETLLADKEVS
ncbi:MAG: hypothetical protein AAF358_18945 [Pseudomonadota bacterium]